MVLQGVAMKKQTII